MDLEPIKKAIAGENLDGWLFFNFLHRDPLADRILEINPERMNSRPWYYLVPRSGEPVAVCHNVEPEQLSHLAGRRLLYSSREELLSILRKTVQDKGSRWGAQFSDGLTMLSTLDHGTALFLESAGIELCSSAALIQRLGGLLNLEGIASHEEAASHLYEIIHIVWDKIAGHSTPLSEKTVQGWILSEFDRRGMVTEHMPVAASGSNSGNPHYAAEENSCCVTPDSVFQLDIWARMDRPGSIFADISWVGYTGRQVPDEVGSVFNAVRGARDACSSYIDDRLAAGESVSGADADRAARSVLEESGYAGLIRHRTGHGIDTEIHGCGTGLDSIEFPDNRLLLEGSCFSIEPGLYSKDFGLRTEINAYVSSGRLKISGGPIQEEILTF